MSRTAFLRTALVWVAAATLMGGAIFLRNHQVDARTAHAPIDVNGHVGQTLTGRNVTATVNGVQLTPLIHIDWGDEMYDDYRAQNKSLFAVFEVTVSSVVANGMGSIDLTIDDKIFGSQYVGFGPSYEQLTPGFPSHGRVTFEIPESATSSTGYLRIVGAQDSRLDSRLVFSVDLKAAQRVPSIIHHKKVGD